MSELSTIAMENEGPGSRTGAGLAAEIREELDRLEARVRARVLHASVDETARPVPLRFRGQVILARPIDTRRFVIAMAPYLCMN